MSRDKQNCIGNQSKNVWTSIGTFCQSVDVSREQSAVQEVFPSLWKLVNYVTADFWLHDWKSLNFHYVRKSVSTWEKCWATLVALGDFLGQN